MSEATSLAQLTSQRYHELVCYPRFTEEEFQRRIKELKSLGVKALRLTGSKHLLDLRILGKGHSSVVVMAIVGRGQRCALKVRRLDSGKPDTSHEVAMLARANSVGVGPRLLGQTANFLLMELIEGPMLDEWICNLKGRERRRQLKRALRTILEQCRSLDGLGLDHGELSRATKHILVRGDHPFIIDFEKSSLGRRASNVTSVCQYLFIGGRAASKVRRLLGEVNRKLLLGSLQQYKTEQNDENFRKILSVLTLL